MKRTQEVRVETCVSDVASDVVTDAGVLDVYGNAVVTASWEGQDLGGLEGLVGTELEAKVEGRPTEGTNTAALRAMRRAKGDGGEVNVPTGGGRPLPAEQRVRFERAFEHDFSHVRVHTDAGASEAADELNAHAFALGADLYFSAGTFEPGTAAGDRLLAHELTHVVQHDEGRLPTEGGVSSPSDPAEQEAYANEGRMVDRLGEFDALASELGADGFRFWEDPESEVETGSVAEEAPETSAPVDGMGFNDLAAACGAADFFDDEFGPKDFGVGDETVMRSEEEAASSEEEPEEGDEGWLMWMLRKLSPELADLVSTGVTESFLTEGKELFDQWVESALETFGPQSVLAAVTGMITGAIETFLGVMQGDQACCETFEGWLSAITEGAEAFIRGNGPLAQLSDIYKGVAVWLMEQVGDVLTDGSTFFADQMWEQLEPLVSWADTKLKELQDVNLQVGNAVATLLGLDSAEGGFTGLLAQGLSEVFALAGAAVADAIDSVADELTKTPWLLSLYELADFAVEMKDGAAWLWNNWDNDDVWQQIDGPLSEELPRFAAMLKTGHDRATALVDSILEWLNETTGGASDQLLGSEWFGSLGTWVGSLMTSTWEALGAIPWKTFTDAALMMAQFSWSVLHFLVDAVVFLVSVIGIPIMSVFVVMGTMFRMLPDCYKAPIVDLCITLAVAGASILLAPLALILPGLAPVLQAALIGVLEGLRGLSAEEKVAALEAIVNVISLGVVGDIVLGLLMGTIEGFVKEGFVIMQAFVDIGVSLVNWGWSVVEAINAIGDGIYKEDPEASKEPPAMETPPEKEEEEEPSDPEAGFTTFTNFFVSIYEQALEQLTVFVSGMVETVAQWLIKLKDPEQEARKLGNVAGALLFDWVATAGIGAVVGKSAQIIARLSKGLEWTLAQGVKGLVKVLETTLAALRVLVTGLLDILEMVPLVGRMAPMLRTAWETFEAWLTAKILLLKKKKGDDDDSDLKKKAQAKADAVWKDLAKRTDDQYLDASAIEAAADANDGKKTGVTYDVEIGRSGDDWWVEVTAKDGDEKKKATSTKKGWIAHDEKGKSWFGDHSAEAEDERLLNAFMDELDDAWDELEPNPHTQLMAAAKREDAEAESQLDFEQMELKFEFGRYDADAGELDVKAWITPNIKVVNDTIYYGVEDQPDFDDLFETVTKEFFLTYLEEPWADEVEKQCDAASIDFEWRDVSREADDLGRLNIHQRIKDWYEWGAEGERWSHREWKRRMHEQVWGARSGLMDPTLTEARAILIDEGVDAHRIVINERLARLRLQLSGGAHADLIAAVNAGGPPIPVIGFLVQMARKGGKVGKISASVFESTNPSETRSWYYRDPISRKEENKLYVKSRFRSAAGGKHEWIPVSKIIDIVEKGQRDSDAEKGAQWIELQHNLRTDTSNLVYQPQKVDMSAFDAVRKKAKGDVSIIEAELGKMKADDFALSGHVGALYLADASGNRIAQSKHSKDFNQACVDLWDFKKNPKTYKREVRRLAGRELWNGKAQDIVPVDFTKYIQFIPSSYEGKKGSKGWGKNLQVLLTQIRDRFDTVIKELS